MLDKPFAYFSLFGLQPGEVVSNENLRERFVTLQKQFHPDNAKIDQRVAVRMTSLVNDAYTTLRNPVSRASYIIKEFLAGELEVQPKDQEFLLVQMQLHEELEQVQSSADLMVFQKSIEGHKSQTMGELDKLLVQLIAEEDVHQQALKLRNRLQYMARLENQIKQKEKHVT